MSMAWLKSICLFTVTACPMGRSMGTVMKEAESELTDIEFQIIYVDAEPDQANQYQISTNPTTLYLSEEGRELYRLEGFYETEDILRTAEKVAEGSISTEPSVPVIQQGLAETYVVYLYLEDELVPVQTEYLNPTSVKSPRLTSIRQLLRTRTANLTNPFPRSAILEQAEFHGHLATISIRVDDADSAFDREPAAAALQKTLEVDGITEVNLKSVVI